MNGNKIRIRGIFKYYIGRDIHVWRMQTVRAVYARIGVPRHADEGSTVLFISLHSINCDANVVLFVRWLN